MLRWMLPVDGQRVADDDSLYRAATVTEQVTFAQGRHVVRARVSRPPAAASSRSRGRYPLQLRKKDLMMNVTRRPWRPVLLALDIAGMLLAAAPHSRAQNYETSWLGNSLSGASSPTTRQQGTAGLHVQTDIWGMAVSSDGSCYTDSPWDEGGAEAGIYAKGQVTGNCIGLHGWGRGGGSAIAVDADYAYVAVTQSGDDGANTDNNSNGLPQYPPHNNIWYCVRRYSRTGTPAPFPAGSGVDGSILQINAGSRPVPLPGRAALPYSGQPVSGIAVDGAFLYVSDPTANQVKVYSLATLSATPVRTWSVATPGPMVIIHGTLFVVRGARTPRC